ncbi:hypothetical protein, partial [Streptomyces sparsus]
MALAPLRMAIGSIRSRGVRVILTKHGDSRGPVVPGTDDGDQSARCAVLVPFPVGCSPGDRQRPRTRETPHEGRPSGIPDRG